MSAITTSHRRARHIARPRSAPAARPSSAAAARPRSAPAARPSSAAAARPRSAPAARAHQSAFISDHQPASIAGGGASAMALRGWLVQSLLLEAIMRREAGDADAADHALQRALELAEQDHVLAPFLVEPIPDLLERHARPQAAHTDVVAEILDLHAALTAPTSQRSQTLREPLTESETRVLRLLATNLSKREIGSELCLSLNTIKTHVKHIYAKLDVGTRRRAVERARELGLLSLALR